MKYSLKIKKKSTHPMGDTVLGLLASGAASIKSVISPDKEEGHYVLCLDSVADDNIFGMIRDITPIDGAEPLDDALMERIITNNSYEIKLLSAAGTNIMGEMSVETKDASAEKGAGGIDKRIVEAAEKKIEAGIIPRDTIYEIIKYCIDNLVDAGLMVRIINTYQKPERPIERPKCLYVDPFLESAKKKHIEPMICSILRNLVTPRSGIIFNGQKSVGKDICARTIAWILYVPEMEFVGSANTTVSSAFGEKTTDNSAVEALNSQEALDMAMAKFKVETNPQTASPADYLAAARFDIMKARACATTIVNEPSAMYNWVVNGGLLIWDEMNYCDPNLVSSILNPILDGSVYLTIPGRGAVKINGNCRLIATQNPDYAGCLDQNESTGSRMANKYFAQPDHVNELLGNAVRAQLKKDGFEDIEIDKNVISQVDSFYHACKTAVEESSSAITDTVLNIRGFVRAIANVLESTNPNTRLAQQIEDNVIAHCSRDEVQILMGTLQNFVTL